MTEPIQIQSKHSYFARECSLTRNNPLHKIKIKWIGKDKIYFVDEFHGTAEKSVRHTFFKDCLFDSKGLFLIQDLGDEEFVAPVQEVEVVVPPEIPVLPQKKSFGEFTLNTFIRARFTTRENHFFKMDMPDDVACKTVWKWCCEYIDITEEDLQAKSFVRSKKYLIARQVAHYLMRKYTNASLNYIGKFTGKHHATVLNSVKIIDGFIYHNNLFIINMVEIIRGKILHPPPLTNVDNSN